MTNATAPDLGPLTWVKGEIDAALSRAREILDRTEALTPEEIMRLHGTIRDWQVLR